MSLADVQFELGKLRDGGIAMFCNKDIPAKVKQVEYYCDARIFVLTFYAPIEGERDHMIQYEVSDKSAKFIEENEAETVVLVAAVDKKNVKGYEVPFIKSGRVDAA